MFPLLNIKKPFINIIRGDSNTGRTEVRYNISLDGRHYDIYFRSSDVPLYSGVEPLLVLALLPAMRLGADLVHSQPICRDLSDNLIRFMEIFGGWFKEYRQVNILGERRDPEPPINNGRVGVFFSGGVDAFYTLFKHQNEITDLICVHGFDVNPEDQLSQKSYSEMCRNVADKMGKGLIEVKTNARYMIKHYTDWGLHSFSVYLACIGHLLSSELSKIYLASSYSQDSRFTCGSHPITDQLLGSSRIHFSHDGYEAKRTKKTEFICEHEIAMDHLRICFAMKEDTYNCGKCDKCLRTMISLYALGKLKRCRTLPGKIDTTELRNFLYASRGSRVFARENLSLLEARGLRNSPVYAALQTAISRPIWLAKLIKYYQSRKRKLTRLSLRIKSFNFQ